MVPGAHVELIIKPFPTVIKGIPILHLPAL